MEVGLIALEILSIIISWCTILLNLRASVPYRGGSTFNFKAIFYNNWIKRKEKDKVIRAAVVVGDA